MKPVIFTYCEGNDTKFAAIIKENEKLKIIKAAAFDVLQPSVNMEEGVSNLKLEGDDLNIEGLNEEINPEEQTFAGSSISVMGASLAGLNLKKSLFVPALTEPSLYYHVFEGSQKGKSSKVTQEIINDIQESKNVTIDKENLGYVELADKSLLSVFLGGEVPCINLINSLARYNGVRYYKIPSVKSAEISLAYYVAKKKKFFPDDYSLIVYIGKEYSKLIFLHGRKLTHIGTTLDIGKINLHTYDVYFSKILLEMENGGIASLDNIIVCGEDDSENLILSFYGTFPEANVSRLEFNEIDTSELKQETKDIISSFSVPIAVAVDYYDELAEEHVGINLLPKHVKEEQKFFQFAWHGYLMLPLLFIATFFITQQILSNNKKIDSLNDEIAQQTILQRENQKILSQITDLKGKINNFDKTQKILDSASVGTGEWTKALDKISNFYSSKKDMWLTKLSTQDNTVILDGYALNRFVLTDFAYYLNSAEIKSMGYESLRDKNAYKYNITFNLLKMDKGTQ